MNNIKESVKKDFQNIKKDRSKYFDEFYKNNYDIVYRICFSILKNRDNSEDVAQNVFEKILKMPVEKMPSEYESSWMYTVAKNECLQYIRAGRNRILDSEESIIENVESENNEIDNIIDDESYKELTESLNKKQEQIISLKVVSDFTFKEIGQIMCMPTATVQWYYYKSIKSLKLALSNLAMFIISFVVGLKVMSKSRNLDSGHTNKSEYREDINKGTDNQESADNGTMNISGTTSISEDGVNVSPAKQNEANNISTNSETINSSVGYQQDEATATNFIKTYGIISVSAIFLTISIIFSIIFIKHQQKIKKKTSK